MDRALRLVSTNIADSLAQTIEALLVIASAPLTVEELANAAQEDAESAPLPSPESLHLHVYGDE